MRSLTFLIFVVITFFCWGLYGPVLHVGQELMGVDGQKSSLRPFICVGIAYFLIAVIYPLFVLYTKGEKGGWTIAGGIWSFTAGLVGAIGALGIILAFKFNGKPFYVMPLVFGLAPVVNTFTSMLMARTIKEASPIFYAGVLIVAVGAAGVLFFKPAPPKHDDHTNVTSVVAHRLSQVVSIQQDEADEQDTEAKESTDQQPDGVAETESTDSEVSAPTSDESSPNTDDKSVVDSERAPSLFPIVLAIALTAVCWGNYGPVLHKGQARMGGSRLRPFLCVGLAYFVVAVVAPILMMPTFQEPGGWPLSGVSWSLGAGAAGAIGALGIIYAFNSGGKPVFIMPLVFGFAPVVNTATEIVSKNLYDQVTIGFWISLALVITGAVVVLTCAPKAKPKAKPELPSKVEQE